MYKNISYNYNDIVDSLPIKVYALNPDTQEKQEYTAIWDCGATSSVVNKKIFNELRLRKVGEIEVVGVNSVSTVDTTAVDIILPNDIRFNKMNLTVCDLGSNIDILLGMDIITQGDFVINNYKETILSYSVPARLIVKRLVDVRR